MNIFSFIFIRHLLVFTFILGFIAFIVWIFTPSYFISPAVPSLFVFFFAATLISFNYLLKSAGQRFIKFVNAFLLTIVVKLLLYIGVMIVYLLINRADAIPFIAAFFILYLCYTIFEAVYIINLTRTGSSGQNPGREK